eukprot:13198030-Alexandrium_andersonii.AAC.1
MHREGLGRGEPERSGPAHRGTVGGGEASEHKWADELMDGGAREFIALRSSVALSDAPRAPAEGPAQALGGPVGNWLLLGVAGDE